MAKRAMSPDARKKLREGLAARRADPAFESRRVEGCRNANRTPEDREKLRQGALRAWAMRRAEGRDKVQLTPEQKAVKYARLKATLANPEVEARAQAERRRTTRPGEADKAVPRRPVTRRQAGEGRKTRIRGGLRRAGQGVLGHAGNGCEAHGGGEEPCQDCASQCAQQRPQAHPKAPHRRRSGAREETGVPGAAPSRGRISAVDGFEKAVGCGGRQGSRDRQGGAG